MFEVTFYDENSGETRVVRANLGNARASRVGLAGSVLDIALGAEVEIDYACGGVCACTTCHVKVVQGRASCPSPTEDEEDMLGTARGRDIDSRLACWCVPDGTEDLVVVIPGWEPGNPGGSVPASGTGPRPSPSVPRAAEPHGAPDSGRDAA